MGSMRRLAKSRRELYRKWKTVCDFQRLTNVQAQQLPSDQSGCTLPAVLENLQNDVPLELHCLQRFVLRFASCRNRGEAQRGWCASHVQGQGLA